jgi:pSer/pThr/pTyr-binding forkhead associated (FHA) protein/low affinity Fe/Cu permease
VAEETLTGSGKEQKPGAIRVTYILPNGEKQTHRFTSSFSIGRDETCEVLLLDDVVSKNHATVYPTAEGWWVRDLGSTNGTYLDGERIENAQVERHSKLQISDDGPILHLELEVKTAKAIFRDDEPTQPSVKKAPAEGEEAPVPDLSETTGEAEKQKPSVTGIIQRYMGEKPPSEGPTGEHTRVMREAFARVKNIHSRRFRVVVVISVLLVAVFIGIVLYQHSRLERLKELSINLFYDTKTMEMQIQELVVTMKETGDTSWLAEIANKRQQLDKMRERYNRFVEETGLYGKYKTEEERLILKMARLFGECELALPDDFMKEVKSYINKWKSTGRMEKAMRRAQEHKYGPTIYRKMVSNHMPPQFLYLALQESNFKHDAVGPKTRFGIAKGIWQFIPDTAVQYGLTTGPLVELPLFDPRDERFDFEKATDAAAKYIRFIYTTEAQASGLLVMASYNWGDTRVRRIIRKMPENPRERNFWRLLKTNKIPDQTHDYVFYIFSAAVIGENPKLFGFEFENPLENLDES